MKDSKSSSLKKNQYFVLISSLFINLCIGGFYAWSIFAAGFMDKFNWSLNTVTNVFMVGSIVGPIANIIGGRLLDKKGPRFVVLSGSVLYAGGNIGCGIIVSSLGLYACCICIASGMSLVYTTTLNNSIKIFPKKKGLISGIMTSCVGVSTIVMAPLVQKMISIMDVSATYRMLGILFMVVMVGCSFFIKDMSTNVTTEKTIDVHIINGNVDRREMSPKELLKTPLYYILVFLFFIGGFAGLTMTSQVALAAEEMVCVTAAVAALAVSWFSFANSLGKLIWGVISDKIGRYNCLIVIFLILIGGEILLSTVIPAQWVKFVAGVIMVALCYGGFVGVFPAITAENFGFKNQGTNYSLVMLGFSLGGLVGPKVSVIMKNLGTTPFSLSYFATALLAIIGLVVLIVMQVYNKKAKIIKMRENYKDNIF